MALVRGPEPTIATLIDISKAGMPAKLADVAAYYASSDPIDLVDLATPKPNAYHYAMLRKLDLYPAVIFKSPRTGYALRVGKSIMATKDRGGGQLLYAYFIQRHENTEILAKIHMRWQRAFFQLIAENFGLKVGGADTVMDCSITAEESSVPLLGSANVFHQVSRTTLLVQLEEGF